MRLIVVLFVLASCSKASEPAPAPVAGSQAPAATSPTKPPATAKEMIASGALVLDVRTLEEYEDGALAGAKHISVDELGARMAELGADKSKPIVVYCATGNRAGKAKQQLEAAGYTQVVNGGGLDDLR